MILPASFLFITTKQFLSTLCAKETPLIWREAQVWADAIRYSGEWIGNEILMCLRASQKRKNDVSLQDPIGTDAEGNEITLIDVLGTEEGAVHDEVERKLSLGRVRELVDRELHGREKMVIALRYGLLDGRQHAQQEIAKQLGISRSYISRIEKKAMERLKTVFEQGTEGQSDENT